MEEKMKRLKDLLDDESNKVIKESTYEEWEDDDEDWDDVGNDVAEFDKYAAWNDEAIHDEIESLCCELFVKGGRPDYDSIRKFKAMSGYSVGPGERDSFGWLTGVVYKGDTMYHCFG